jgi:Sortilin, neurotensin receptor 3,
LKKNGLPLFAATILLISAGCQIDNEMNPEENTEIIKVEEEGEKLVSLEQSNLYGSLQDSKIDHVHGIGYPGNRNELLIATHNGPIIYHEGFWYEAKENKNDYMGFNAVSDGFYSSGHPGEGSDLPNPLGLVKSTDRGNTIEELGFQGEADFHYLTVGYESHAIYAVNQMKNSKMDTGVYYSEDAKEWEKVQLNGTPNQVSGIATHPTDSNVVAITSPLGLFVSSDKGESFDRLTEEVSVSSVTFMEDQLVYAKNNNKLVIQKLKNGDETELSMPENDLETLDYIAVSPQDQNEIVFHTAGGSIYRTNDRGESWNALVKKGEVIE